MDPTNKYLFLPFKRLHVKLNIPSFYRHDPKLWFQHLETQFHQTNILADIHKYHATISSLPLDYFSSIINFTHNRTRNCYEIIKAQIIKQFQNI